ncbi:helix-turn-helix domain-containing protein [Domibacillus robiginosus]|uniref:helix-turn-helix domain-containing protein n=1 Tax=Domibacillus robiginosus TaxID=1071054 RepID=UPI000A7BA024|nr:helix-turn-helix domain-containing protein [Domibacillus robiginosus]
MRCLEAVVLCMLKEVEGERTASSVFHLLKGKKSAQTIQDAHLFKLDKWFQTTPFLTMALFDQLIEGLQQSGCLEGDRQRSFVTAKGRDEIKDVLGQIGTFPHLSGWKLGGTAPLFFSRLQLAVQVVSHLAYQDRTYYPITRDEGVQQWVKQFVKKNGFEKGKLAASFHREIRFVLEKQPEHPDCLLLRFSGHSQTGKTIEQTADLLCMEPTEYWFRFLHSLHAVVQTVMNEGEELPLLKQLLSDITVSVPLTESARKTAAYLHKGMKIEEVAAARRLKRATIEDHIVELALNDPYFSIRPFIDEQKEAAVLKAGGSSGVRQLKPLKDRLPDHSYFEIRLVLAKESRGTT